MSAVIPTLPVNDTSKPSLKRPYFAKKSDWATWEAAQVRLEINRLHAQQIPAAQWRHVRSKQERINALFSLLRDWERRAARFREEETRPGSTSNTSPYRAFAGQRW